MSALALAARVAHDRTMLGVDRVVRAVRALLLGPELPPEEHLRRQADRLEAEADMRRGIERASKLFGRTNRFVR